MASQERLSVEAAAERLGITPDAVRSRIKRGTLWAVRRDGRVEVLLRDAPAAGFGAGHEAAIEPTIEAGDTALRLRAELAHQRHRVRDLERERGRLLRHLKRQQKFLDLECSLRARLSKTRSTGCASAWPRRCPRPWPSRARAPTGSGAASNASSSA